MTRSLPFALLVLAVAASTALASVDFNPAVTYPLGGKPEGGALVDLDGDGHLDLAVTSDNPNKIEFFKNRGDGTFAAPTTRLMGNATGPEGLAPGDFNGDGVLDFAVVLFGANQVQLVFGDGAGGFTLGPTYAAGTEPSMIVASDFDGDGDLDAALNNRVSGDMSVYLNDGAGAFASAVNYPVGAETRDIAVGDFNGDGRPDLAVTARDTRIVRLFDNVGGGAFHVFRDLSLGSTLEPQGVTFADFDGDGALDVATATTGQDNQQHPSIFLQNNGGRIGIWVGPVNGQTLPGVAPTGIAAADFDLDGFTDVATSNADTDDISVNKNGGIGIFFVPVVFPVGQKPEVPILLAGDLDRNGSPDLISLNQGSEDFSVLINRNHAPLGVEPLAGAMALALHPAIPNPTLGSTSLTFDVPRAGEASLVIYDVAGRLVRTLVNGSIPAGRHHAAWDGLGENGARIAAGAYVVRLASSGETRTQLLVLVR
jgi:FG-GAP-like repeat/FlgD Ig-like domain